MEETQTLFRKLAPSTSKLRRLNLYRLWIDPASFLVPINPSNTKQAIFSQINNLTLNLIKQDLTRDDSQYVGKPGRGPALGRDSILLQIRLFRCLDAGTVKGQRHSRRQWCIYTQHCHHRHHNTHRHHALLGKYRLHV